MATTVVGIDAELVSLSRQMRERAESLRSQASVLDPVLGTTYRRRASELELEAWLAELQSGLPYSELHSAA